MTSLGLDLADLGIDGDFTAPVEPDDETVSALVPSGSVLATSEEARRLNRGFRQLEPFPGHDLPGKSARAVSEAILAARNITGRRDRIKQPSRRPVT
jgi:hypothetical protein